MSGTTTTTEPIPGASVNAKYADFDITNVTYKHVKETPIPASILVPKNIQPGKKPVVIRWHGGGLIIGERLFAEWWAEWNLALTLAHDAICISPDYRLLPEAKGVDVLQDAKDFFAWLFTPGALAQHLPKGVEPNLDQVLMTGESAGGWLALQSGFFEPHRIAAIIAAYPMIDMRAPHYSAAYTKQVLDPPLPQMDPALLEAHLQRLTGDEVVTGRLPPDGFASLIVAVQTGRYTGLFGAEPELYPLEVLPRVESFPPLWIFHGDKDSLVPMEGTTKFVDAFRAKLPAAELHVTLRPGEEHGFDGHEKATGKPASLETEWVKQGVEFTSRFWPV